jgi:site-specific DNA-methyltransferase (adenine-specific)
MSSVQLYHGDCLEYMRSMADGSVDAVVTDPPYGCGKADWDDAFPVAWYSEARRITKMVAIITGASGLKDSIPLVGEDFVDVISARNLNGMTRSPAGFGNWIACVLAGSKPRQGVTFFEFTVSGEMPNHPSPKPIGYMMKLICRLTDEGDTIFDPFMGSGTTGVACVKTGRNFIGCEIDPGYFAIAEKRIAEAQMQLPLLEVI